jgi:hypothetical protein
VYLDFDGVKMSENSQSGLGFKVSGQPRPRAR